MLNRKLVLSVLGAAAALGFAACESMNPTTKADCEKAQNACKKDAQECQDDCNTNP